MPTTPPLSAPPPITIDQDKAFEGYPGLKDELINGEIVLSPQPKPLHQRIVKTVMRLLDDALQSQGLSEGYEVQSNTNLILGGTRLR